MTRRRFHRPEPPREPPTIEGRVPPHDLDAEAAVLSAVMNDRGAFDQVADTLKPEHFYSKSNGKIFEATLALAHDNQPIDIVTISTWLRDREQLARVGGTSYLAQISDAAPSVVNVAAYARTVRGKWRVRRTIAECQRVAAEGYGDIGDPQAFIDAAEQSVYALAHTPETSTMQRAGVALKKAFDGILEAANRGQHTTGVSTGFERYDDKTSGMHNGETTVIAGRPGMGKTAIAMAIGINVASPRTVSMTDADGRTFDVEAEGHGVAVFSLEMPREGLALRSACAEARVDGLRARKGHLQPADWSRLTEASAFISSLPLWFDDTPGATLLDVRAKVRRLQAEYNRPATATQPERRVRLVIIDYLQLMSGDADSREQEISMISRGLKNLAKELDVHVIVLSQLNRSVETRTTKDKRPQLSDLRESGAIEQDADNIVFVYRDEYYNPETTQAPGVAELIIAKQRNGPTGKVLVRFDKSCTRFDNLASHEYPQDDDE